MKAARLRHGFAALFPPDCRLKTHPPSRFRLLAVATLALVAPLHQAAAQSRPLPQAGSTPFVTPLSSLLSLALTGDIAAMLELAARYEHGSNGAPTDWVQAATWYAAAAKLGDARAERKIGTFYEQGMGVKQDIAVARSFYEKAAGRGDVDGLVSLGSLYDAGHGVDQDQAEAARLYQLAVDRGSARAALALGMLYEAGLGISRNIFEAERLYAIAAADNVPGAADSLARVANALSG
jgi:TPR repeat protein